MLKKKNMAQKAENEEECQAASIDEIRIAYDALSEDDTQKILLNAKYFSIILSKKRGDSFDCDDIFSEAITRVLEGNRKWYPNQCTFCTFLIGVMKSITYHEGNTGTGIESKFLRQTSKEDMPDPLDTIPSPHIGPEEQIMYEKKINFANAFIARLELSLKDDSIALEVLDGWKQNLEIVEIMEILNLSRKDYETIQRRIMRRIQSLKLKEGDYGK